MLRSIIFWTHLCVGLVVGTVVFILCLTGAILAFELQIITWAEHDARARPRQAGMELLSPAQIAAKVTPPPGEHIVSLEWSADQDMPVRVLTDQRHVTLLNGYSGEILGPGAVGLRGFMRLITELHVNLVLPLTGHWMVAIANVGFVFLIMSGLWLWWPRQWRWQSFRVAMTPRLMATGKARDWNWHTTLGFWFLLPLFAIATTGLVLSFAAADTWWRAFGGTHLFTAAATPATKLDALPIPAASGSTWSQGLHVIQERYPGWRSIMIGGNGTPNQDGVISLNINHGTLRHRASVVQVKLDTRSGQLISERTWANDDGSTRARAIARLGHTGEILGTWGQFWGFLACVAGCVIVYTGFALSWRRFFKTKKSVVEPAHPPLASAADSSP